MKRILPCSPLIAALGPLLFATADVAAAESPDFTTDIAPVFTKHCTGCHNDEDREGKLSLASYESLLKGGAKGGVVTPGQADVSRLVRVITGQAEPKMPPDDEPGPTAEEIERLKSWIAAGAKGPGGAAQPTMLVTPDIELLAPPKLPINAIALSPQADLLAIARHGEVEIVSIADGKSLHKFDGIPGSVNGVSFSPDGASLVVAAGEPGLYGEARIYKKDGVIGRAPDDGPRSEPATFRGHRDSLYSAALSPDGTILATGGYDNTIQLWDVASGAALRTLDAHNGAVFEIAFRPDGKVLASASGDRTVKLWNVATGERLDTLKESTKELYALAFSPDGQRLASAGVDNRIRVWRITADAKEGTNTLLETKFAHEMPVLRLAWSVDGRTIASAGEDRLVKIWNADTLTIRDTLPVQSDWASGLALTASADRVVIGRVDGTHDVISLVAGDSQRNTALTPLADVPPEVDYGPQPPLDQLPKVAEVEPNDEPASATVIATPGVATGKIARSMEQPPAADGTRSVPATVEDVDLYRFEAKAGDQWILETKAAQAGSPLDSKIEVLDAAGEPVPRLLLRSVRDSVIEFRGMNSDQRGVRLAYWEEMLLNDYVYLSGEVIKHYQQRRGPDADAQFYPENGNRHAFFNTTSRAHALGEPAYIVVPYAVGTELPDNGLPVFTLNYENDDDSQRKLGKDSKLTFVAPADGTYFARVSDVRGYSGESFTYELTIRRPAPDFNVSLTGNNPTISAASGKQFTVKAERIDNFHGPIQVEIAGVPAGFQVTTPLVIQEGLFEANGVINALDGAAAPTEEQLKAITVTATATIHGQSRSKDVSSLGTIKLAEKPQVVVHLEPIEEPATSSDSSDKTSPTVKLQPGGTTRCRLRVERKGFDGRIGFDVPNLPHGVIVDDIGLSGVLIPEGETERTIVLRAEPWVPAQSRTFFAVAQVEGNQASLPLALEVRQADAAP